MSREDEEDIPYVAKKKCSNQIEWIKEYSEVAEEEGSRKKQRKEKDEKKLKEEGDILYSES